MITPIINIMCIDSKTPTDEMYRIHYKGTNLIDFTVKGKGNTECRGGRFTDKARPRHKD